jgi:hypothetical protein
MRLRLIAPSAFHSLIRNIEGIANSALRQVTSRRC